MTRNVGIPSTPLEVSMIVEDLNTQDILIDAEAALLLQTPMKLIPSETEFSHVDEDIAVKTGTFSTPCCQDISLRVEELTSQGVLIEESEAAALLLMNSPSTECNDPAPLEKVPLACLKATQMNELSTPLHTTTTALQGSIFRQDEVAQHGNEPEEKNNDAERVARRSRRTTTYNEDELSDLVMSSQGGETDQTKIASSYMVSKTRDIQKDVEDNKFTTKSENPRGKSANFMPEAITHGVYKSKSGFTTVRPLLWAQALEEYIKMNDTQHKWDYLCDIDDVFTECHVKIFVQGSASKKVLIEIGISSGVVKISGNAYTWNGLRTHSNHGVNF